MVITTNNTNNDNIYWHAGLAHGRQVRAMQDSSLQISLFRASWV